MTIDNSTTRMLDAYLESRVSPKRFLTNFFKLNQRNIHNSEHVMIDVRRGEPVIAIPVPSVQSGARKVEASKSTNKKFTPTVYDMETTLSAWSASQRQPGQDPFQDPDFRRNVREEAFRNLGDLEEMVRRGCELMSAQVLQTGKISLTDSAGVVIYDLDFQPKTTHFVTVGTTWHAAGTAGDPEADIDSLATVIRRDGKQEPTDLVFGTVAKTRFLKNSNILTKFDNQGLQKLQNIVPPTMLEATGAKFFGTVTLGNYVYRCWVYDDYYIEPNGGAATPYVADDKVIITCEKGRLDMTYGSIPMFLPPEARVAQFLPTRMSSLEAGVDLSTNIYVTPDGKHLTLSAGTRPLPVPTAIDTFGCLDVII